MKNYNLDLSIVIPVFNEEESLLELSKRLMAVTNKLNLTYEILFVDDGSTDNSRQIINQLEVKFNNTVKSIFFKKNYGKSEALSAGFKAAFGKLIFMMDADLQDLPEEIPKFLEKMKNENLDMVNGWRYKRQDKNIKRLLSKIYNWVTFKITGVYIHDMNCGFKLFKAQVLEKLKIYGELHRYILVLVHNNGFNVGEVKIEHQPRLHGVSKYNSTRIIKGFLDLLTVILITKFYDRPLYFFGTLGIACCFISIIGVIYYEILGFTGYITNNSTMYIASRIREILAVIIFLFGFVFFSVGLIGQYVLHYFKSRE